MLETLAIRDMLLIEAAEMRFRPGLNVLTGETGAGKSILLDCLGFVLGWRGRGEARAGATEGEVTAGFALSPGHAACAVLEAAGVPAGDELILRRTVGVDGRRQAWANDRRVTAETLRALADVLVELHGQKDDRGLLDARGHRTLLDAFGEADLGPVRAAWAACAAAERALDAAREALAAGARDREFLEHALAELDRLDPQPGEEPALDARRRQMRAAARIREDIARAGEALGPEGAEGTLLQALRWLEGAASDAEGGLDGALDALSRTLAELGEASGEVERVLAGLDGEPGELERVEERLFAIRALARKHQAGPEELSALADHLRARLAAARRR